MEAGEPPVRLFRREISLPPVGGQPQGPCPRRLAGPCSAKSLRGWPRCPSEGVPSPPVRCGSNRLTTRYAKLVPGRLPRTQAFLALEAAHNPGKSRLRPPGGLLRLQDCSALPSKAQRPRGPSQHVSQRYRMAWALLHNCRRAVGAALPFLIRAQAGPDPPSPRVPSKHGDSNQYRPHVRRPRPHNRQPIGRSAVPIAFPKQMRSHRRRRWERLALAFERAAASAVPIICAETVTLR